MKIYEYKDGYLGYSVNENKIYISKNKSSLEKDREELILDVIKHNDLLQRNFNKLQLMFITTTKCNLKCKYCYENLNSNKELIDSFTVESLMTVYNSFRRRFPQSEIYICFFGGEPFLEKQTIKEFIYKFNQNYINNSPQGPSFGAVTNGTLLDQETINMIVEYFDALTISMDGISYIHDENRIYKDDRGSYENVYNNIKLLKKIDKENKIKLSCEATLTDAFIKYYSNDLIDKIWTLFKELDFKIVEFVPVRDVNSTLFSNLEILKSITQRIIDLWFDDLLNEKEIINIPTLYNYLTSLLGNRNESSLCTAGYNYFSITPSLEVFPCQVSVYHDNNVIGQVKNNELILDMSRLEKYKNKSNYELCKRCECIAGCGSFCKVYMSDINMETYPESCIFNKIIFKQMLFKITDIMHDKVSISKLRNNLVRLSKIK